ncbi:Hypothetical_protein [Hexamita inflata]|uniref:Hypothetical_protein n=1 Tax=Hexamita inflata TaxID=28002 RepID=A0AA86R8K6_9EUKA|nr:Hypothetical protein HINF_LOCUS51175 [Hexamita inflata]
MQIPNFGVYCRWQINYFLGFRRVGIFLSSLFLDKLFLIFHLELLLLGFRQEWLGFLFCVSYKVRFGGFLRVQTRTNTQKQCAFYQTRPRIQFFSVIFHGMFKHVCRDKFNLRQYSRQNLFEII